MANYNIDPFEEPEKYIIRNNGCKYDTIKNELIEGNCENEIPAIADLRTQCIVCGEVLYCEIPIRCDC